MRPVRAIVLEEDEHLQNLRKIIKRDFFGTASKQQQKETINLSLDSYLCNYKSNENKLFSQMVQVNNQQWKDKHWWFEKQDKMLMIQSSQKFKALPYHNMLQKNAEINGIDTSIVKQDAKNSFFFNRQKNFGSYQSEQHSKSKRVVYSNCKLDDPLSRMRQQAMIKRQQITPLHRQTYIQNKNQNSPPPQDDGQLMTWGQIDSTPVRIAGPQFKIPETPQRQLILHQLNNKINKEKQHPARKSQHVLKILGSLTPSYNSSKIRLNSSIRRIDSVKREKQPSKNDLSGLLNIKK